MPNARAVVRNQRRRTSDSYGSGPFSASRHGRTRAHLALDIAAEPHEMIFAPIRGVLARDAMPHKGRLAARGMIIRGAGEWQDYEVRILNAEGLFCGQVSPGQHVGFASGERAGMSGDASHLHIEVRCKGRIIRPQEIFSHCL